jgi:hypothetical protein
MKDRIEIPMGDANKSWLQKRRDAAAARSKSTPVELHNIVPTLRGYFEFVCPQGKDKNGVALIFTNDGPPKQCPVCRIRLQYKEEPETPSDWDEQGPDAIALRAALAEGQKRF